MTSIKKITYFKGSQKYTLDTKTLLDGIPQGSDVIHGKVKLSDQLTSTEGVLEGVASTPKAVKTVNDGVQAATRNIGNLKSLTTKVKDNLVNAINEVNESSDVKFVDRVPEIPEAETLYVVPNDTNEYDIIPDVYATKLEVDELSKRSEVKFVTSEPSNLDPTTLYAVETTNAANIFPDIYATKKELSDLSNDVIHKAFGTPTFFVSVNGDDKNDGSEEHPFKTLQAALNYCYDNVVVNRYVEIKFLSNYYQETDCHIVHNQCGRYFVLDGNGFNVTLSHMTLKIGHFSFENINFKQQDPKRALFDINNLAEVYIVGNSTIEIADNNTAGIFAVYNAALIIDKRTNITFKTKGNPANVNGYISYSNYRAYTYFSPTTCTIENLTKIGFFRCAGSSFVCFDKNATLRAPLRPSAYAYEISYGGHITFFGKGKPLNMGDLTKMDKTSTIS